MKNGFVNAPFGTVIVWTKSNTCPPGFVKAAEIADATWLRYNSTVNLTPVALGHKDALMENQSDMSNVTVATGRGVFLYIPPITEILFVEERKAQMSKEHADEMKENASSQVKNIFNQLYLRVNIDFHLQDM